MDPFTTTLITIIGLISIFKQERKAKEDQNKEAFISWLEEHRHNDLKEFILRTKDVPGAIDKALQEDHEIIIDKLKVIDELLATFLSHIKGIKDLTAAIYPNTELSEQAISILRQFIKSKAEELYYYPFGQQNYLQFVNVEGSIDIEDLRLLGDDMNTLEELGFLRSRYSDTGTFYGITRNAIKLIEAIDKK